MYRKFLWVIPIVLAALLFGQAALAQSTPDTVEMIGVIEAVGTGTVTINGQVVQITTAEIDVTLSPGQIVKIEGTTLTDGSIFARQVQAPNANDLRLGEIELTGEIESIGGSTITISGIVIDLGLAEISGALEVGGVVKVHASVADDGTWVAREAENAAVADSAPVNNGDDNTRPGEFEITGTLEAAGDGFIVVNGQQIAITGAEIKNALVTGTLVKVHLSNQDGQLTAREVENALGDDTNDDRGGDDTPRPGEFEITGTLEAVGDGFIVVDGQQIAITGAEIKNTLVTGTTVKVHLSDQNGQLIAREVENALDDGSSDDRGSDDDWDDSYTVRPGDTLSSIAARAGTTVDDLARMNNLTSTAVIVAGTRLRLPHEIESHDTNDDNSGRGSQDDDDRGGDDDNSGSGSQDDDDDHDDDNSGRGSRDDDDSQDDNSGSGSHDDDRDDD